MWPETTCWTEFGILGGSHTYLHHTGEIWQTRANPWCVLLFQISQWSVHCIACVWQDCKKWNFGTPIPTLTTNQDELLHVWNAVLCQISACWLLHIAGPEDQKPQIWPCFLFRHCDGTTLLNQLVFVRYISVSNDDNVFVVNTIASCCWIQPHRHCPTAAATWCWCSCKR